MAQRVKNLIISPSRVYLNNLRVINYQLITLGQAISAALIPPTDLSNSKQLKGINEQLMVSGNGVLPKRCRKDLWILTRD